MKREHAELGKIIIQLLLGAIASLAIYILGSLEENVGKMNENLTELNEKMINVMASNTYTIKKVSVNEQEIRLNEQEIKDLIKRVYMLEKELNK